jgi:hypothetical protein
MKGESCYYITALPALGELGSEPPLTPSQLLEHVADNSDLRVLVEVLFLFDDLCQREAFLAGEIKDVDTTVLKKDQARNAAPLPRYLVSVAREVPAALQIDGLWDNCFRHAKDVAQQHRSIFLADWVGHEVALRNALAVTRARRLGLEASNYLVATDLADSGEDLTGIVNEWKTAPTPLTGLQVLIKARWTWLVEHDAWFTFNNDELAAYAAKLMLLHQWRRLSEAGRDLSANQEIDNSSASLERTAQ